MCVVKFALCCYFFRVSVDNVDGGTRRATFTLCSRFRLYPEIPLFLFAVCSVSLDVDACYLLILSVKVITIYLYDEFCITIIRSTVKNVKDVHVLLKNIRLF